MINILNYCLTENEAEAEVFRSVRRRQQRPRNHQWRPERETFRPQITAAQMRTVVTWEFSRVQSRRQPHKKRNREAQTKETWWTVFGAEEVCCAKYRQLKQLLLLDRKMIKITDKLQGLWDKVLEIKVEFLMKYLSWGTGSLALWI